MKINRFHIINFKSILDLEISQPSPFTVFVGPNGSGKSNIFEAIEFFYLLQRFRIENIQSSKEIIQLFGGLYSIVPKKKYHKHIFRFTAEGDSFDLTSEVKFAIEDYLNENLLMEDQANYYLHSQNFFNNEFANLTRLFIGKEDFNKMNLQGDLMLNSEGSNIEKVLSRILQNDKIKQEIVELLQTFVPELRNIEVAESKLTGKAEIGFYENNLHEPLPKTLISDGTLNILALLTAVYQLDAPQFLLIEEPENGLNPYVIRELVSFFRRQCEEKGHYIWLNTHSPSLVKQVKPKELVIVDKINGETKIKQFPANYELYELQLDEAWLSNALGGGLPW